MKSSKGKKQKMLRMKESPGETVSNSIDLLTDILIRLPIKLLLTFKCVSKHWLSLISNPEFCLSYTRHHHTRNTTPTALLLKINYDTSPDLQIVPLKHDDRVPSLDYLNTPDIKIQHSCNGLFLYSILQKRRYKNLICNPATNQFKLLSFPSPKFKVSMEALNLAFDPLKSPHYKVISIHRVPRYKRQFVIDTYSSETDSWTLLGLTFTVPHGMEFDKAVFCNGAIHWDSEGVHSLYFDVDNECLKTMPMPALIGKHSEVRYFGESCGHLHIVVTENPSSLKFRVLEMATDYSQWFVRYHIDLDVVRTTMPELISFRKKKAYQFSVLGVIRAETEEESMVVLYVDDRAFSYNPYNGTSKKLCDIEPKLRDLDCECFDSHQFFETLCSV